MEREPLRGEWSRGQVVLDGIVYRRVFTEDDATLRDPDRTRVEDASLGFLGRQVLPTLFLDAGDGHVDVEPGLAVLCHSYDGSSLYLVSSCLPYAALFGLDMLFAFEAMAAIRDALRAGLDHAEPGNRDRRLPSLARRRLESAFAVADSAAGVVQNPCRLSGQEYTDALAEIDRAAGDPVLRALDAGVTLDRIRRILVASVLPTSLVGYSDDPVASVGSPDEEITL